MVFVKKRGLYGSLFIIALVCFIAANWVFPYSYFSLKKEITYKADSSLVQNYNQDVDNLKENMDSTVNENLTKDNTSYILDMVVQDWLIKNNSKIAYKDLDSILIEVRKGRVQLIDLAFNKNYSQEAELYLKTSIAQCLALEESLIQLMNSKQLTRAALNRQIHNLHIDFSNFTDNFNLFINEESM